MRLTPPDTSRLTNFNKDIFGYKDFGERLRKLVYNVDTPLTLILDGDWGTGKSTFIRQWQSLLTDTKVIYFDAFAHDFQEDAFLALASQITSFEQKKATGSDEDGEEDKENDFREELNEKRSNLTQKAAKIITSKNTYHAIADIGLRTVSGGHLTTEDLAQIATTQEEAFSNIITERLSSAETEQDILKHFREALTDLAQTLTNPQNGDKDTEEQTTNKPLIFIIDDLYTKLKHGQASYRDIHGTLCLDQFDRANIPSDFFPGEGRNPYKEMWTFALSPDAPDNLISTYQKSLNSYFFERDEIISNHINQMETFAF